MVSLLMSPSCVEAFLSWLFSPQSPPPPVIVQPSVDLSASTFMLTQSHELQVKALDRQTNQIQNGMLQQAQATGLQTAATDRQTAQIQLSTSQQIAAARRQTEAIQDGTRQQTAAVDRQTATIQDGMSKQIAAAHRQTEAIQDGTRHQTAAVDRQTATIQDGMSKQIAAAHRQTEALQDGTRQQTVAIRDGSQHHVEVTDRQTAAIQLGSEKQTAAVDSLKTTMQTLLIKNNWNTAFFPGLCAVGGFALIVFFPDDRGCYSVAVVLQLVTLCFVTEYWCCWLAFSTICSFGWWWWTCPYWTGRLTGFAMLLCGAVYVGRAIVQELARNQYYRQQVVAFFQLKCDSLQVAELFGGQEVVTFLGHLVESCAEAGVLVCAFRMSGCVGLGATRLQKKCRAFTSERLAGHDVDMPASHTTDMSVLQQRLADVELRLSRAEHRLETSAPSCEEVIGSVAPSVSEAGMNLDAQCDASNMSWIYVRSEAESQASVSWVSVAQTSPQCFLPRTVFQQPDGRSIRAANLCLAGGEVIRGLGQRNVFVQRAVTHPAKMRKFVCIHTDTSMLEVTEDHRLMVRGPDGNPTDIEARNVRATEIFDGQEFHVVQRVAHTDKYSEVIEINFQDDAPVLAWLPAGRKVQSLDDRRAFAVKGEVQGREHTYMVNKTFISTAEPAARHRVRRTYSANRALSPHMTRRLANFRAKWQPGAASPS